MIRDKGFWWFFKRIAFYSFLILITIFLIIAYSTDGSFGINKTVGWEWDRTNFYFHFGVILFLIILIIVTSIIISFLVVKLVKHLKGNS